MCGKEFQPGTGKIACQFTEGKSEKTTVKAWSGAEHSYSKYVVKKVCDTKYVCRDCFQLMMKSFPK